MLLQQVPDSPGIQEYQLQVEAGPEHEHVAVKLDLSDGAGWQRLAHSHQPHNLVARVVQGHVQHILPDLQVAAAMDDLGNRGRVSLIPTLPDSGPARFLEQAGVSPNPASTEPRGQHADRCPIHCLEEMNSASFLGDCIIIKYKGCLMQLTMVR